MINIRNENESARKIMQVETFRNLHYPFCHLINSRGKCKTHHSIYSKISCTGLYSRVFSKLDFKIPANDPRHITKAEIAATA